MEKKSSGWKSALKALLTIGIFVALFAEFGGGPVAVSRSAVADGSAFLTDSPDMPGLVAKLKGAAIPAPVPLALAEVCKTAASGKPVYLRATAAVPPTATNLKVKALRHCEGDNFSMVLPSADAAMVPLSSASADTVWLQTKGKQLVEIDFHDLWREITSVRMSVFLPWFLFAIAIKLVGIFANVYRWKVLLDAQGVNLSFGWLNASYWVGRYWGIVTPSTMGLDGWRLYDSIRATKKPVECVTALAVERLIGLVGLLGAILIILPFADIGGQDFKTILKALMLPIACSVIVSSLFLLQPGWFAWIPRVVPHKKLASFAEKAIRSATAYSSNRTALVIATMCAIVGQFTTFGMYIGNAYAFDVQGVSATQILAAAAVMTFGTFVFPSASGEGVREFAFVALLGGHTTAAKAFLIGHLGFWIEKLPLSVPGGFILMRAPAAYRAFDKDEAQRTRAEAEAAAART